MSDVIMTEAGCKLRPDGSWRCRIAGYGGYKAIIDCEGMDEPEAISQAVRLFYAYVDNHGIRKAQISGRSTADTSVSGYSFGPEPPYPAPDGYFCPSCGRPDGEPHDEPCIAPVDPDAVERACEREAFDDLVGYRPEDALVGFEKLAVGL